MTTKEAFAEMISTRGWYQEFGIEKTSAGAIVNRFKKGTISIEKMEELLEKKGFKVVQEKLWEK